MKKLLLALGLGLFSSVTIAKDLIVWPAINYYPQKEYEKWKNIEKHIGRALSLVAKLDSNEPISDDWKLNFVVESLGLSLSEMEKRQRKAELLGRLEEAIKSSLSILFDTDYFIIPYTDDLWNINLAFYPHKIDKETLARENFSDDKFFEHYDVEKGRLYATYDQYRVDFNRCHGKVNNSEILISGLCNRGKPYIEMSNKMAQELILDRKKTWKIVATIKVKNDKDFLENGFSRYIKSTFKEATIYFISDGYDEFRKKGKAYYSAELKFEQ